MLLGACGMLEHKENFGGEMNPAVRRDTGLPYRSGTRRKSVSDQLMEIDSYYFFSQNKYMSIFEEF